MSRDGTRHCSDALAEYAAGALTGPALAEVEAHLTGCPSCRAALASWAAVAAATVAPVAAPPSTAGTIRAVLTRAALAPQARPVARRGVAFAWWLLRAEVRLVRRSVWLASALVMACAVLLAVAGGDGGSVTVLSLVAPVVAVAGVAGVYGPGRDPAFEALAITVTSPRLVLLARVTLVFAYDLALALATSAVVRLAAPEVGLVELVVAWLGPMTLLSALSLLLAMWIGPNVSMAVAASLWALRVATVSVPELARGWLAAGMRAVWATSPGTVAVTLVLLAAAVALSRRPVRRRGAWYRPVAW
jgi:Putative zinc-finger